MLFSETLMKAFIAQTYILELHYLKASCKKIYRSDHTAGHKNLQGTNTNTKMSISCEFNVSNQTDFLVQVFYILLYVKITSMNFRIQQKKRGYKVKY